jgi:two-component system, LytTR family, response regulator
MKIRAIIVDDEPHAREGIKIRLREFPEIDVAGECSSGSEAVSTINTMHPQLLFLDIQMPEMNGFEVLRHITADPMPAVIFVTAYDTYAIQAFECHALDYLLKPIREDRFRDSMHRVLSDLHRRNLEQYVGRLASAAADYAGTDSVPVQKEPQKYLTRLAVKLKHRIAMLPAGDIDWIESAGDYVFVHCGPQKHLVRDTLASLEGRMDPQKFVRIHRSTIVNLEKIKSLCANEHGDYDVFLSSGVKVRLSRSYRTKFETATGSVL